MMSPAVVICACVPSAKPMMNPGNEAKRHNPTKTNGCLNNVENESDRTVPTEKTEKFGAPVLVDGSAYILPQDEHGLD